MTKTHSMTAVALMLLIFTAYQWIDRPLCEFIYAHHWQAHLHLFKNSVKWPPVLTGLSPFLLLLSVFLKPSKFKTLLIFMSLTVLFTFVLKNELKWIFSRYWPLTWKNNNLSWIGNHAYGFQWFQGPWFSGTDATGSFPSGHTAIAFATFLPIGLVYKRALPYCIILATLEGLLMVAFNYHFLSDVLAGALVGITCSFILYHEIIGPHTAAPKSR